MERYLRDKYKEETHELLAEIEAVLLDLEKHPENTELLTRIFGMLHTVKGASAMFGFDDIAAFAHEVETIFDQARNGRIAVTKTLVDLSLSACDRIRRMLESKRDAVPISDIIEEFCRMPEIGCGVKTSVSSDGEEPEAEPAERIPVDYQIRFRPGPNIFLMGTNPLRLLDELRGLGECRIRGRSDAIPPLGGMNPEICYLFWDARLTSIADKADIRDIFVFVEDDDCEISITRCDGAGESGNGAPCLPGQETRHASASGIRVSSEKLDILVNLVGELVTLQTSLLRRANIQKDPDLIFIAKGMERLTEELRHTAMSIRMLPIGKTFGTFRRLVRDLSGASGKDVIIRMEGGDTELDKDIIDRLGDPLLHIIRNSIAHGIEAPSVRKAAGKPEQGTISLSAEQHGGNVFIRISDDGAGIDTDAIRAGAEKRGLLPPDAELPESRIHEQIFVSGISTAEKITGMSGRGMGMDVVKRRMSELRGSVEVGSRKGEGTLIVLKLPLTLAIIDGMLVRVGEEHFVFPLSVVEECLEISREDAAKAATRHTMGFRGEMLSYLSLREFFMLGSESPPDLERVVLADTAAGRIAFGVDQVVGQHQTVIKSLGRFYRRVPGISGATVLGNGMVALVLDVDQIVEVGDRELGN